MLLYSGVASLLQAVSAVSVLPDQQLAAKFLLPSAMRREVHQPESLHELINVDAAVLVEVDARRQVCYGLVADVHLEMGAQELPGLTELL